MYACIYWYFLFNSSISYSLFLFVLLFLSFLSVSLSSIDFPRVFLFAISTKSPPYPHLTPPRPALFPFPAFAGRKCDYANEKVRRRRHYNYLRLHFLKQCGASQSVRFGQLRRSHVMRSWLSRTHAGLLRRLTEYDSIGGRGASGGGRGGSGIAPQLTKLQQTTDMKAPRRVLNADD